MKRAIDISSLGLVLGAMAERSLKVSQLLEADGEKAEARHFKALATIYAAGQAKAILIARAQGIAPIEAANDGAKK